MRRSRGREKVGIKAFKEMDFIISKGKVEQWAQEGMKLEFLKHFQFLKQSPVRGD